MVVQLHGSALVKHVPDSRFDPKHQKNNTSGQNLSSEIPDSLVRLDTPSTMLFSLFLRGPE